MAHFYFLLALAALSVVAFVLSISRGLRRRSRLPYVADGVFLSKEQLKFLAVLRCALGDGFGVFARVRVIDVIGVTGRLSKRQREAAFARLDRRFFDFLVCRNDSGEILCAVNLAPASKLRKSLPKDGLEAVCDAAGLPFVRFQEGSGYSVDDLRSRLSALMGRSSASVEEAIPEDEALQALQGLTAAIKGEKGAGKPTASSQQSPARLPRERHSLDALLSTPEGGRREPSIRHLEPVEDGPEFHIPADLDDEGFEEDVLRRRKRA